MANIEKLSQRLAGFDWPGAAAALDAAGHARLPRLLSASECDELVALYQRRERFRSFVALAPHRFGENGDYRYFARPLPRRVQALRTALYRRLAPIANRWQERLGSQRRFPASLRGFLAECAAADQRRPTPLLLRYDPGGLNFLHRDVYGDVAFPLQVVVLLSRPGHWRGPEPAADFGGGEFLLSEQRPRMQSRAEAISLERGEGLVFPNAERPIEGVRGPYRSQIRHGMSRLHWGERYALGIIFHDAR